MPRQDRATRRALRTAGALLAAALLAMAGCTGGNGSGGNRAGGGSGADQPTRSSPVGTVGHPERGDDLPRFEKADCAFTVPDGYDVSCGYLETLQDRANPNGGTVRLHVGVFHRKGAATTDEPIVYLEGGPGGNALQAAAADVDRRFGAYAARRDIVIFDQRGTGYSEPRLDCPALDDLVYRQLTDTSPNAEQVAAQQALLPGCRQDLVAGGVDLAHYNSVDSAADVAELRQVLGYDTWDVYSVSYGTRLAQTLLRTHPEGIRSVVLDSTYPIAVDPLVTLPDQTSADYRHFFDACTSDPACQARYPDLEARFAALVARLDREPVTVTAHDFVSDEDHDVTVTGADLQDLLFQSLYDQAMFAAVPRLVADLEAGRTDSLATFAGIAISQFPLLTLGAHLAVECHEEVPFSDPDAVRRAAAAHPEQAEQLAGQIVDSAAGFESCRRWDAGRAGPEEDQPVTSAVPTLLLSGGFDPITPTDWARQVASSLSSATLVVFPTLGHGVGLAPGCPQDVVSDFLADPGAPPDSSCVASMPPPAFAPDEEPAPTLGPFTEDVAGVTVTGVRPTNWPSAGPGVVGPQRNVLDQTSLLQQAVPGASTRTVVSAVESQLHLDADLSAEGSFDAGGTTWNRYHGTSGGNDVDLAVTERDHQVLVALLVSPPERRDALVDTVLQPALAALRVAG